MASEDYLWWNNIRCGKQLLENVTDALSDEESVIISGTATLPWKDSFYAFLETELSKINGSRALSRISHSPDTAPGKLILDTFCDAKTISGYWPQETYGSYLANAKNTLLGQRFIVVENVNSAAALTDWKSFIADYYDALDKFGNNEEKAVFIIEAPTVPSTCAQGKIKTVIYDQSEIDIYSFSVINTADGSSSYHLSRYAAELITIASKGDPVLAGALSAEGSKIAEFPEYYIKTVYYNFGIEFDEKAKRNIYFAQLKYIFPLLELKKISIIGNHLSSIQSILPIKDCFGNKKFEPYELELKELCAMYSRIGLSQQEKEQAKKLRDVRNHLAHNRLLSDDCAIEILNMIK